MSAKEIAKQVFRFIDPETPGGASYAALRLGRTELNNAFHTNSIKQAQAMPWVEGVKWNLSGSHPRPDECNEYAEDTHYRGGDGGVFLPQDVPPKPHPNCLCFTTTETQSDEDFIASYRAGDYNDYFASIGLQND
jgi:hypothetical protein